MSDRSLPQRGYWHELYELSFDQANERVRALGEIGGWADLARRGEITAERALAEIAAVAVEQFAAIQQPVDATQSSGAASPAPDPRPAAGRGDNGGGTGPQPSAGWRDLVAAHEYDELIFGGWWCMSCTPQEADHDPDLTVPWPCPPLLAAGMTAEDAADLILAERAARGEAIRPTSGSAFLVEPPPVTDPALRGQDGGETDG